MNSDRDKLFKSILQVFAFLCLVALISGIAHQVFVDITTLAQQHSGRDFWAALARHVVRNFSGG